MPNILSIGTGGCGNKMLEKLMSIIDVSELRNNYDGLFMNSNLTEMECLDHFNHKTNALIINGAGTGKDQSVGLQSVEADKSKIANTLSRLVDVYDAANIITSMDGGFGSSSISTLSKFLRQLKPELKINILAIAPKLESSEESLKNTLATYNMIKRLLGFTNDNNKAIINGATIVDNEMMRNMSEDEFNEEVMQQYLDAFECAESGLDVNDQLRVASANGYRLPLQLNENIPNLKGSIDIAVNGSPFMIPNSFNNFFDNKEKILVSHIAGVIDSEVFSIEDWRNIFRVKTFDKIVDGELNSIVLGGLTMPNERMELYQIALKELSDIQINHKEDIFEFEIENNKTETPKKQPVSVKAKKQSRKKKLLNLLESNNVWDN